LQLALPVLPDRADNFKNHGKDFRARSPIEYEQMAVAFLKGRKEAHIIEGTRRSKGGYNSFSQDLTGIRSHGT
jgi:hypothetical protein